MASEDVQKTPLEPDHKERGGWLRQRLRLFAPAPAIPGPPQSGPADAVGVEEVLRREFIEVDRLYAERTGRSDSEDAQRTEREVPAHPGSGQQNKAAPRFGLAFSGGGIRSASTNLGLIQALAKGGLLRELHYISGVSGGGYILGWLTAWIARVGFRDVERQLGHNSAAAQNPSSQADGVETYCEPNPIHYLRRYVSYLMPRSGFGSGDTLAVIAIYLRNMLLMLTMVVAALIASMALLQMIEPAVLSNAVRTHSSGHAFKLTVAGVVLVLGGVIWIALGLLARNVDPERRRRWATMARWCGVALAAVLWIGVPAWLRAAQMPRVRAALIATAWATGLFALAELIGSVVVLLRTSEHEVLKGVEPQTSWWARVLAYVGTAILVVTLLAARWRDLLPFLRDHSVAVKLYAVLGMPVILVAGALVSFLFIGLFGDAFPDGKREWLGRLAGYYLYFAASIAVTLFAAFAAPDLVHLLIHAKGWKKEVWTWLLPGGWVFTTVAGLFAARSPATGAGLKKPPNRALEMLARIAPAAFLFGLMVLVSWATHRVALVLRTAPAVEALRRDLPHASAGGPVSLVFTLLLVFVGAGALAVCLGWRLSVNEFSLHLFYRNRLVRTFLGASNVFSCGPHKGESARMPDPFTGFTLDDDRFMGNLMHSESPFDGPYPIWCTALNLTGGEDLAWQQRKAASFIYSPMYCGWDHVPNSFGAPREKGYREVAVCDVSGNGNGDRYGGKGGAPLIGTAMAASGAAVSPNWGYHTEPATAALLALFNVRIGWWTGNPMNEGYTGFAPGAYYFLHELLGSANERRNYVYLSDGGHFENLGVYELVRRRVKYIIACDADSDPAYTFGDLANAVEKCRVDFGVQIRFADYSGIAPDAKTGRSRTHYAVGLIDYPGDEEGVLLYVKNSITGDEPAQVLGQQQADNGFPHDTTLNQFFNETQFEAYRALGEHLGEGICEDFRRRTKAMDAAAGSSVEVFFEGLLKETKRGIPAKLIPSSPRGSEIARTAI